MKVTERVSVKDELQVSGKGLITGRANACFGIRFMGRASLTVELQVVLGLWLQGGLM